MRFCIPVIVFVTLLLTGTINADLVLSTSTLDSADLDFDGPGIETDGSLAQPNHIRSFTLTGNDIPIEFVDVDSITILFESAGDTGLSARAGNGNPAGIGVNYVDSNNAENLGSLDTDGLEAIFVSLSFNSSNQLQDVFLSGVSLVSFDNTATVHLIGGATQAGQAFVSGPVDPTIMFDDGVAAFGIESTGVDSFRMNGISIGAAITAGVPEPSSAMVLAGLGLGLLLQTRRRR